MGWTPSHGPGPWSVSRALAVGLVIARPPRPSAPTRSSRSFIAGVEAALSSTATSLLLQVVADRDRERQATAGWRRGPGRRGLPHRPARGRRAPRSAGRDRPTGRDHRPVAIEGSVLGLSSVSMTRPGIVAAVEHLVGLGHSRIAHVGGPGTMRARRLPTRGVVHDAACSRAARGTLRRGRLLRRVRGRRHRHLLDLDEPPTAIIYANDLMAMAGLSLAVSRGIGVPGELSIIGFDDTEVAAHLQPALTTVGLDADRLGQSRGNAPAGPRSTTGRQHRSSSYRPHSSSVGQQGRSSRAQRMLRPHSDDAPHRSADEWRSNESETRGGNRHRAGAGPDVGVWGRRFGGLELTRSPRRGRSRSGSRTTPRRSPGARRWSRTGTPRTPRRR